MHLPQLARAATVGVLAAILLTGCASEPSPNTGGDAPETPAATEPDVQTQPDDRQVVALEVIDPVTVVVTPKLDTDELYGEEFTVHVNDIITPAEGECGYDEALTLAESKLVDNTWFLAYGSVQDGVYVDDAGDHHGRLDSRGLPYGQIMIDAGMAYLPADGSGDLLAGQENDAQAAGTGLWTTCPDFGA